MYVICKISNARCMVISMYVLCKRKTATEATEFLLNYHMGVLSML